MTQERINEKFNGSAKYVVDTLKLWLPLILGLLSLILSLYTYRLKTEVKEEIKSSYLSKEEFSFFRKDLDRSLLVTEGVGAKYVTKDQWDKIIPILESKISDTQLTQAKVSQTISNLENLMKEVRDDLREIRKNSK